MRSTLHSGSGACDFIYPHGPPLDPHQDELDLMERIAQHDAVALRALYERLGPLLLAMGCRVLHDRQLAEDVLNEVFLELWKKPAKYDPTRSSPRTFMILVMRRRSIDRLRSRKAGVKTVAYDRSDTSNHSAANAGPADHMALAEERDHVRDAIGQLPDEQRRAIEMSFFDGKTNVEIADETGVPLGTIKGRIRLGLIRLRNHLRTTIRKEDGHE